jgi:hypothetical protein
MTWIAIVLCSFVSVLGVIGVVSPGALLGIARNFQSPAGLYAAATLRILLGAALLLAARTSRAPRTIRAIGVIILVAGLLTPVLGLERFRDILAWWSEQGPIVMRLWAGFALAFGSLLAYTVLPKRPPND